MTTTAPLRLLVASEPDGAASPTTWDAFAGDNAEGFTAEELAAMRAALASGESVPLNMGAGGLFTLTPACECGGPLYRRQSGELMCRRTADTYKARYGTSLD